MGDSVEPCPAYWETLGDEWETSGKQVQIRAPHTFHCVLESKSETGIESCGPPTRTSYWQTSGSQVGDKYRIICTLMLTYIPSHLYAIYDPITKDVYTMNHRRFIYECVVQFLEEALQGFGKVLGKLATMVESIF